MAFKIIIDKRALADIEEALDYYHKISPKLSKKFFIEIRRAIKGLTKNPFFQIRYKDYRCLPLKLFPFMFHYIIDEKNKIVIIYALRNTFQSPDKWL